MTSSLVGSEMCIRDRRVVVLRSVSIDRALSPLCGCATVGPDVLGGGLHCLLYTSDAADDM
eukprot:12536004-Prorocentrum_lima.AAC.1